MHDCVDTIVIVLAQLQRPCVMLSVGFGRPCCSRTRPTKRLWCLPHFVLFTVLFTALSLPAALSFTALSLLVSLSLTAFLSLPFLDLPLPASLSFSPPIHCPCRCLHLAFRRHSTACFTVLPPPFHRHSLCLFMTFHRPCRCLPLAFHCLPHCLPFHDIPLTLSLPFLGIPLPVSLPFVGLSLPFMDLSLAVDRLSHCPQDAINTNFSPAVQHGLLSTMLARITSGFLTAPQDTINTNFSSAVLERWQVHSLLQLLPAFLSACLPACPPALP